MNGESAPFNSDPDALPASNYLVIQTPGDNLAAVGAAQPVPGEQLPPPPPSAAGGAQQPPPFGPTGSGGKGASVVSSLLSQFIQMGSELRYLIFINLWYVDIVKKGCCTAHVAGLEITQPLLTASINDQIPDG